MKRFPFLQSLPRHRAAGSFLLVGLFLLPGLVRGSQEPKATPKTPGDNWHLLFRYIQLALPQQDGSNLSALAKKKYLTQDGRQAYDLWRQKHLNRPGLEPKPKARDEEFIKRNLIHVNIEGVCNLYSRDLPAYFKNLDHKKLHGLEAHEQQAVREDSPQLPQSGWVMEIRGYTYNQDGGRFLELALLENLRPQGADRILRDLPREEQARIRERITSRVGYFLMYRGWEAAERVRNPQPGQFKYIGSSSLPNLVPVKKPIKPGPLKPPDHSGKPPDGPQPKVELAPRTEFILLFIWDEFLEKEPAPASLQEKPLSISSAPWLPLPDKVRLNRLPQVLPVAQTEVDPAKAIRTTFPWGISVLAGNRQIQVDYLAAGVKSYEVHFSEAKVLTLQIGEGGGEKVKVRLAEMLKPRRLIVVHAVYDFDRQLQEFAQVLGFAGVKDLVKKRTGDHLLPHVVGLDVTRLEWKPGDAHPTETKIYQFLRDKYNPPKAKAKVKDKETVKIPTYLDIFFRETVWETQQTRHLGNLLERGLVTPLPVLLTGRYPELKVRGKGMKLKPLPVEEKPFNPFGDFGPKGLDFLKKGQPNQELIKTLPVRLAWDALNQEAMPIVEKFKGEYYPLDPEGALAAMREDKKLSPPSKKALPEEQPSNNKLIRFIDVLPPEARPGYSYGYSLRVWLANPFHGRPKENFGEWSKRKLLDPGSLTYTPAVTLPPEYFYYAVDQQPLVSKAPKGNDVKPIDPERVAVQIHRWIDLSMGGGTAVQDPYQVADWVVAERLLVRRGEVIGRRGEFNRFKDDPALVHIEIPYWDYREGRFVLTGEIREDKKKNINFVSVGIPMYFRVHQYPPVLVDFEGGTKSSRVGFREVAAYEMLILDPDNHLVVRRSDVDTADPERQQRYNHWRDQLRFFREPMKGGK